MKADARLYPVMALVAAIMTVLCVSQDDEFTATLTLISCIFAVLLWYESRRHAPVDPFVPLIATVCMAVGSFLMAFVLEGDLADRVYAHLEGIVVWFIAYPLAYEAALCIAVLFGSILNRYEVGGFMVFNCVAMVSVALVSVSIFNKSDLDKNFFFVDEMAYLMVSLVLSIVAAFVFIKYQKGKDYLLCRDHLEAQQ
ncbi:MAG: hypothetical protein ACOX8X_01290 [Methanomethylophilus sp.]|jgi:uncharacterized membrane-anchored protein YitT (DUF2179 family)